MSTDSFIVTEGAGSGGCLYLFRVSEVSPEGVVNACCNLLGVTGHGLNEHLQRALQQLIDASVVVVIISAYVQQKAG